MLFNFIRAESTAENSGDDRPGSQAFEETFFISPNLNALSSKIGAHLISVAIAPELNASSYFSSSSSLSAYSHSAPGPDLLHSNSQLIGPRDAALPGAHHRFARSPLSADSLGSTSGAAAEPGITASSTSIVDEQHLHYQQLQQQYNPQLSTSDYFDFSPTSSHAHSRQFQAMPEMHLSFMLKGCVLFVMFGLSLAFNALAATKLARHASRLSIYRLMFHLTLADMVVSFSGNLVDGVWLFTYEWVFGAALCKARKAQRSFGTHALRILRLTSTSRVYYVYSSS